MATYPICADLGATDDRGSHGGHLRSNDVTIRFSPISRDRMENRDTKMVPNDLACRAASEDVHNDLLGSGHDLTLT